MSLINEINNVQVTAFLSLPPQYVFHITGNTAINHWKSASLVEVVHIMPPEDRIQEFTVEIELTDDSISTETMQSIEVTSKIMLLADWAVGARFIAAKNCVEKQLGGPHRKFDIDLVHLTEIENNPTPFPLLDRPVPWPWRRVISNAADNNPMPFPFAFSVDDQNQNVREFLKGRKLRVLKPGDVGTAEIDPGRVTIQLTDTGRIESVQIDPDSPVL